VPELSEDEATVTFTEEDEANFMTSIRQERHYTIEENEIDDSPRLF
jgi:hypothetical protein